MGKMAGTGRSVADAPHHRARPLNESSAEAIEGLDLVPARRGNAVLRVVAAWNAAGNPRLRCRSLKREYGCLGRSPQFERALGNAAIIAGRAGISVSTRNLPEPLRNDRPHVSFYAQTLQSSDRKPTASAMCCGLMSSWPSRSAIVRATRKTLSWASRESHILHRRLEDRQRLRLQGAELPHLSRGHPAVDLRAARAEPLRLAEVHSGTTPSHARHRTLAYNSTGASQPGLGVRSCDGFRLRRVG
jgi:hypothetical protein